MPEIRCTDDAELCIFMTGIVRRGSGAVPDRRGFVVVASVIEAKPVPVDMKAARSENLEGIAEHFGGDSRTKMLPMESVIRLCYHDALSAVVLVYFSV